jgi:DNA repair protein RecO (recombination protein O)
MGMKVLAGAERGRLHAAPGTDAMEWSDEAIVLGTRRHGENNIILELLTRAHGRHLGLVRGGAGARMRAVLQPGNSVMTTWRARLDEHLGHFAIEGLRLRAGDFITSRHAIYAVTHLAALIRLLPERDPHEGVFEAFQVLLDRIDQPAEAAALAIHFELQMLTELGFGLDLSACAATGATIDLVYVSPKSGRAVSRAAGEPWRDKLLPLPHFLLHEGEPPTAAELVDGFALTGFFLARHAFEPRGLALADARAHFVAAVLGHQGSGDGVGAKRPRLTPDS